MLILAFDTALAACAIAVWRDGATLASSRRLMERGQAEHLVPMIADTMTEAGVAFDALDRIAVTVGPGSFTGVRVGLATARGLALAHKIPVVGFTTGTVLAAEAVASGQTSSIVSLIDSKRGDLYVECFAADGSAIGEARTMPSADGVAWLSTQSLSAILTIVGDGAQTLAGQEHRFRIMADIVYPNAAVLAALAAHAAPPATGPVPLYVRPPDVTLPHITLPPGGP